MCGSCFSQSFVAILVLALWCFLDCAAAEELHRRHNALRAYSTFTNSTTSADLYRDTHLEAKKSSPVALLPRSNTRRRRSQQQPRVRTIASVDIVWTATGEFSQEYVDITCNAVSTNRIHFLADESLDLVDCINLSHLTLRCQNFRRSGSGEMTVLTVRTLVAQVVVACEGETFEDVDTVTASMPETTVDWGTFGSFTRQIRISPVCSSSTLDGSLRHDPYGVVARGVDFGSVQCSAGGIPGVPPPSCLFSAQCSNIFSSCPPTTVPEVSATIALPQSFIDEQLFSCYYAADPPPLPALGGVMTNDPTTTISYFTSIGYFDAGCTVSSEHSITYHCGDDVHKGVLQVLEQTMPFSCSNVDESTVNCPMPIPFPNYGGYGAFMTCTGTDLPQLTLSATWNPGNLDCTGPSFFANHIYRAMDMFQVCPLLATPLGSLGLYADDIAVTCYPMGGTLLDQVTLKEEVDNNGDGRPDETQTTAVIPIKVCTDFAGIDCGPTGCGPRTHVPRLVATILPQHINLDPVCLAIPASLDLFSINADGRPVNENPFVHQQPDSTLP